MYVNRTSQRVKPRKSVPVQRRRAVMPTPALQNTYEGSASARRALRTGIPRLISQGDSIIVENNEIAMTVTGTATTGVVPAGGAIRIMQFDTAGTGNNLNTTKWISKIATAYDKWVLEDLELYYVPSLPFTAGGMYSLFFDSDPTRTAAPVGVAATSGDMRAISKQIYAEANLKVLRNQMNRLPQYETYPTAASAAVATVGSINFSFDSIILAQATAAGSVTLGNVWMKYRIRFLNPSNAP